MCRAGSERGLECSCGPAASQACRLAANGHSVRALETTTGIGGLAAAEHAACWLGTAALCQDACMPGSCCSAACSRPCSRAPQALVAGAAGAPAAGWWCGCPSVWVPTSQASKLSGSIGRLGCGARPAALCRLLLLLLYQWHVPLLLRPAAGLPRAGESARCARPCVS